MKLAHKEERQIKIRNQLELYVKDQIDNIRDRLEFSKEEFSNAILILRDELQGVLEKVNKQLGIQELNEQNHKNLTLLNQNLQSRIQTLLLEQTEMREKLKQNKEKLLQDFEYSSNLRIIKQKVKILKQENEMQFEEVFQYLLDIKNLIRSKKFDLELQQMIRQKLFSLQLEKNKLEIVI